MNRHDVSHNHREEDSGEPVGQSLVDHFRALEESLLSAAVRQDHSRMDSLLADDFMEFGVSGRVFGKQHVMDSIDRLPDVATPLSELEAVELSDGAVLVTYRSTTRHADGTESDARRASVWVNENGGWRLRFHQGTPTSGSD